MKFSELEFHPHPNRTPGVQALHEFANGFGVSVVKFAGSVGWLDGLYEMAVMGQGEHKEPTYMTDVADDVLGHLTPADVEALMAQVELLDAEGHLPANVTAYRPVGCESEQARREQLVITRGFITDLLGMIRGRNT